MRHDGGNTLKSQDHREGLRALPLNAMECVFLHRIADIEQVLREKKPFILRCMLDGIKKLQGRMVKWNRCALSVSITWA